jgi:F420-non-reducing hydrogenase iron-sulfur subunit
MAEYEPKIIAFCCNWCTYAAADIAGTSRTHYPANVRIVRVMCSGMVDPIYVLKAFEMGADGVLVAGCHEADCHYLNGPAKCDAMFEKMKRVANTLGLEDERLRRQMIAAAEAPIFAEVIEEMVNQLKKLGPSPLREEVKA